MNAEQRISQHLAFLYGEPTGSRISSRLWPRLESFRARHASLAQAPPPARQLSERDSVLITYGDQMRDAGHPPLQTLGVILKQYAHPVLSIVHLLPFFPYSSDDGFSVIDYTRVNPDWGTWADVETLGRDFRLMFDAVINHISRHSAWFRRFLEGDPAFAQSFITVDLATDLSQVVRPRALPLLTPVETTHGPRWVWTTFSSDQIDLNYDDPQVLLRVVDVLLDYVAHGAQIIRLDAIAYLWKKPGTSCIHLPETHHVVQLFRAILDQVAPGVLLITETNVPHQENISYFGDGHNEAQLVYQFPLPPLVLHTFIQGNSRRLTDWAASLRPPSEGTTFFNFLASHDGIGVRPVEGILSPAEVAALVERTMRHGGFVSPKANADGSESVYELNISYFDALSDPQSAEPLPLQVARFVAAHAIMLSLQGLPALYIHSLFGSRSDRAAVAQSGQKRAINRARFRRAELEVALSNPRSLRAQVYGALHHLLDVRRRHPAFHPAAPQTVHNWGPGLFVVERASPQEQLCALINITAQPQDVAVPLSGPWQSLLDGRMYTFPTRLALPPYRVLWLTAQ